MDMRDDARLADEVEKLTHTADALSLDAKNRMRKVVEPKIEAAVAQREAMVAELTSEPVQAPASELAKADPRRVTITHVRNHPHTFAYLDAANQQLKLIGYTEHGRRHAALVGHIGANVLRRLNFSAREIELAEIAGLLHDIGNSINRNDHGQTGAILAKDILSSLAMPIDEIITIMGAIGNHEEERGHAVSSVAAALILADKSDVHRSRVQNSDPTTFDIHDRVNYAATKSFLRVDSEQRRVTLQLTIDTEMASVMDYFEIFLSRMVMCRRAAEFLGSRFGLSINDVSVL